MNTTCTSSPTTTTSETPTDFNDTTQGDHTLLTARYQGVISAQHGSPRIQPTRYHGERGRHSSTPQAVERVLRPGLSCPHTVDSPTSSGCSYNSACDIHRLLRAFCVHTRIKHNSTKTNRSARAVKAEHHVTYQVRNRHIASKHRNTNG